MPSRPCKHPTCSTYVKAPDRFCAAHADQARADRRERDRFYDQHARDQDAKRFYNSAAWARARAEQLATFPICRRCNRAWSTTVHHVKPLADCSEQEAVDQQNLRSLCSPCHTIVENAGGGEVIACSSL